jgi:poly(3-hydroxybutyrate) depolymerase
MGGRPLIKKGSDMLTLSKTKCVVIFLCFGALSTANAGEPDKGFVHTTFTDDNGKTVRYVVFVPHSYDGKKAFPVILFLHGGGEKKPIPWGPGTSYIKEHEKTFDFITVFPHMDDEKDQYWKPEGTGGKRAIRALDEVMKHYKTDPNRVYLTGFSIGGICTWELGAKTPERWAALVPVAGRSYPQWTKKVKDIPVWAFNGATDAEIPPENTRKTIALLKELGAHPKYTEYPGVGHTPENAYREKELYAWLRKQSKNPEQSRNPVAGDWRLNQPSVGESTLHITKKAGNLEVQEVGNGNARSTIASCKDGLLVVHWEVSEDLRGYWVLNLNQEHTTGSGRTVFIRFKDFEPGEPREIEGRKVRVVEGVTIERIAPNGS